MKIVQTENEKLEIGGADHEPVWERRVNDLIPKWVPTH